VWTTYQNDPAGLERLVPRLRLSVVRKAQNNEALAKEDARTTRGRTFIFDVSRESKYNLCAQRCKALRLSICVLVKDSRTPTSSSINPACLTPPP
jgi:hypothetical protein